MEQIEIKVRPREVLGKKVRFLRRKGITPLNLYGANTQSLSLETETATLQRVLSNVARNVPITLQVEGEKATRAALLWGVQRDPLSGTLLHLDFYQVDMAKKLRTDIPVILLGEAAASRIEGANIAQHLNMIEVECLPGDLPSVIEVNISELKELGQEIRVKDINLGLNVTVLTNPDELIVKVHLAKVEAVVEEKPVEEVVPEEAAAEEAKAEAEEEKTEGQ